MSMRDLMNDVRAFHEKCGVPVKEGCPVPERKRVLLRMDLHAEEWDEVDDAMWAIARDCSHAEYENVGKELCDLIYVLVGTALELGIPLDRVWDEVHASNMTKSADHTRADGKILKGPDYRAPDIHRAIWGAGGEGDNG